MQIILSSDDYADDNPFPEMEIGELIERYPMFCITLLAITLKTSKFIDNPCIKYGFHGLNHEGLECSEWTKDDTEQFIDIAKTMSSSYNVKFCKVFKAPRWKISQEAFDTLTQDGWIVYLHPNDDKTGNNVYRSHINPKQIRTDTKGIQKVTTHVADVCGNGIRESMGYLMNLPETTKFHFIDSYMREEK